MLRWSNGKDHIAAGRRLWIVAAAFLVSFSLSAYAQMPGYPAPRDPDYKKALHATVDDLMPVARLMVKKPSRRMALSPGYGIKAGENVLIVVSPRFDANVLEAIRRAMVEAGAYVDIMKAHADPPATVTGRAP